MKLIKLTHTLLGGLLLLGTITLAQADDKKVDPSGSYQWTMPGRNGTTNETDIADAKLAGADVSFTVVRTFNGNTMTNKYSGTVADGAIKGKIEFNRNGDAQSRDWEAKLQK